MTPGRCEGRATRRQRAIFRFARATGDVRGPLSKPPTAPRIGGTVRLITPSRIFTMGVLGGFGEMRAPFTPQTLDFVPKPSSSSLLGPGVAGLAAPCRRRMRS